MRKDELDYHLPPERIAQRAIEPRDAARLLVLHRSDGRIEHRHFRDVGDYLNPGDCLVVNNTQVIPARFHLRRKSGGRIEALFLHADDRDWTVLLKGGGRLKPGERLTCEGAATEFVVGERGARGAWRMRPDPMTGPLDLLEKIGQTPLPPYIRRGAPDPQDVARYQTVYAAAPGAVAAPTAGMHFTPELLERLAAAGVRRAEVTLHVGPGTFTPIETQELVDHRMHAEWFELGARATSVLGETRNGGGRLVAVGTTAARVLESLPAGEFVPQRRWTDIFIYPPYTFRNVDVLITNFHLPGSTLLALVMALATPEQIRRAYDAAIAGEYRFYSYGDAMIII